MEALIEDGVDPDSIGAIVRVRRHFGRAGDRDRGLPGRATDEFRSRLKDLGAAETDVYREIWLT